MAVDRAESQLPHLSLMLLQLQDYLPFPFLSLDFFPSRHILHDDILIASLAQAPSIEVEE